MANSRTSLWNVYAPIIVVVIIAILGFLAMTNAFTDSWYSNLSKSPLNPPNWVFSVVWPILYVLIIIAWIRANASSPSKVEDDVMNLMFVVNLILNLSWTYVFFSMRSVLLALIILIIMVVTAGALIYLVRNDIISLIFVALYTAWLIFAFFLNLHVYLNN